MVSFLLLGKGPSLPLFQQGKVTHLDTVGWTCVCTHTLLPWAILQWSRLGSSSQTPSPLASPLPSDAPSVSGLNNGDLVLKDISYKDDGLYQCTVANHVGYSVCVVEVKVSGGCRQWLLGWEGWMGGTWAVFWSLSRISLMGLINAYSSAKVSQEALGETCKYEELTCLSPYIPPCVSKGPISWVPHPFSYRSPVLATPG